ncbi:MAG: S8 family serine peptidase, partial [Pseudomonadales bacterium]|nr:S8 family serine peptidase [Pseudomonadales bacterium]
MKSAPRYNDEKLEAQFGDHVASVERLHAWSTGKGVKVGVIDTPIDRNHPDLESRIETQEVFFSERLDSADLVHGTAVAGIIGAQAGNGIGIVGFAPDTELHSYAACFHRDDWQRTVCNTFSLAKALAAVADDGIHVLNMSLAGPEDFLLARLIDALINQGTMVVASDNPDSGALRFPASMARVIAATRLGDTRQTSPPLIKTDDEHLTTGTGGTYQYFYGSSMSAARVTALISLLLERNPGIDDLETRRLLADIADNCHTTFGAEDSCAMKFAISDQVVAFSMNHDHD